MADWRERLAEHEKSYQNLFPPGQQSPSASSPNREPHLGHSHNVLYSWQIPKVDLEKFSPQNAGDSTFKPDHYTLQTVREGVNILNDLEEKFSELSASAAEHRIELLTQSNEVSRLLRFKDQSKAKLTDMYGDAHEAVDVFDIKKTPIATKLRNLQSASFKLRRELDEFKGPTITSALAAVSLKLDQLQDKINSLRDQEQQNEIIICQRKRNEEERNERT